MMLSYRSGHPNHAHQLMVSVSKHYYLSREGILKYQKKPMEVTLKGLSAAKIRHMVIQVLRDHCSGVFYAEVAFGPELPTVRQFLARAWGEKASYPFHGLPILLSMPQTVKDFEPALAEAIEGLGVTLVGVTSGFQGGIRDLRTIESNLILMIGNSVERMDEWMGYVQKSNAKESARVPGQSKIQFWQQHVPITHVPHESWGLGSA